MKEKLRTKTFPTKELLIKWANSKEGTDYIISINYTELDGNWHIFYIA